MRPPDTAFFTPVKNDLLHWSLEHGRTLFDPVKRLTVGPRDTLWWCIALLLKGTEEDRRTAEALLRDSVPADATHTPATLLAILLCLSEYLHESTVLCLWEKVRSCLALSALEYWHDGNINHPLAAWVSLILAGEKFGDTLALSTGIGRLYQFREKVGDRSHTRRRQSTFSEYLSPTYTALDLCFLSLVAEHARSPEARSIALFLEERLWLETALWWHAPTAHFSGPYSRAYLEDSFGGFSGLSCTLAAALDLPLFLDPDAAREIGHDSALLQCSLLAIHPFHVPSEVRNLLAAKPFPLELKMTTYGESYHENHARFRFHDSLYPGGWSELTSYQTHQFCLGTASLPYVNAGHADALVARIRTSGPPVRREDVRSITCRGVFQDAEAGRPNHVHVTGGQTDATYLYEEGRTATHQVENRALVLYRPKTVGESPFSSFRVDIFLTPAIAPEQLMVGGKIVPAAPMTIPVGSSLLFRVGKTFVCLFPLTPVPKALHSPVVLRKIDLAWVISIYNHRGPLIQPPPEQLLLWRNGFYLELRDVDEFGGSMQRFSEYANRLKICDEPSAGGRDRVIEVIGDHFAMGMVVDVASEVVRERTMNGERLAFPSFSARDTASTRQIVPEGTLYGGEAWSAFQASRFP